MCITALTANIFDSVKRLSNKMYLCFFVIKVGITQKQYLTKFRRQTEARFCCRKYNRNSIETDSLIVKLIYQYKLYFTQNAIHHW